MINNSCNLIIRDLLWEWGCKCERKRQFAASVREFFIYYAHMKGTGLQAYSPNLALEGSALVSTSSDASAV